MKIVVLKSPKLLSGILRLVFKIKKTENGTEIGVIKADGQTACVILIN